MRSTYIKVLNVSLDKPGGSGHTYLSNIISEADAVSAHMLKVAFGPEHVHNEPHEGFERRASVGVKGARNTGGKTLVVRNGESDGPSGKDPNYPSSD